MRKVYIALFSLGLIAQSCKPVAVSAVPPTNPVEFMPIDDLMISAERNEIITLTKTRSSFDLYQINSWYKSPVVHWNEITRDWVAYYYGTPLQAARIYAMISVAQQRSLDYATNIEANARHPENLSDEILSVDIGCKPMECGALIGSTESMLIYFFPEVKEHIFKQTDEARQALLMSGNILPSDLDIVEALGRKIAEEVISERLSDGAATADKFEPLSIKENIWKPDPFQPNPQAPSWGKVSPWLLKSGEQFRPVPPPEYNSAEFQLALDEVYQVQQTITHEQLAIAEFWADNPGTFTPPGHWNLIASELITKYKLSSVEAGHIFATLNMAMMDASIGCWDAKYYYLVVRPWQADNRIKGLVGYPNHPSYPSGHSCFSAAGAEVLASYFPLEEILLRDLAKEASLSRLYGGLHYRFDLEEGLRLGKQVGTIAVQFAIKKGWIKRY